MQYDTIAEFLEDFRSGAVSVHIETVKQRHDIVGALAEHGVGLSGGGTAAWYKAHPDSTAYPYLRCHGDRGVVFYTGSDVETMSAEEFLSMCDDENEEEDAAVDFGLLYGSVGSYDL